MSPLVYSRRTFFVVTTAGLVSACTGVAPRIPGGARASAPGRIRVRRGGRIESVGIEDYVLASALAEVSPVNEPAAVVDRIFDVQTILARSFAASNVGRHRAEGFDLCDSSHCQLYDPARVRSSRFAAAARASTRRTAGVILSYSGRPASALFHADCGGHTADADAVWGGAAVPYLRGMADTPRAAAHRTWEISVPADRLRTILNEDSRSRVGARLRELRVRHRDTSGRAVEIEIAGAETRLVRGEDLRAILNRRLGDRAIQSTRFSVRLAGRNWVFHGTGFGHGVGLCQRGAAARARQGDTVEKILASYFRGATLG